MNKIDLSLIPLVKIRYHLPTLSGLVASMCETERLFAGKLGGEDAHDVMGACGRLNPTQLAW